MPMAIILTWELDYHLLNKISLWLGILGLGGLGNISKALIKQGLGAAKRWQVRWGRGIIQNQLITHTH